MISIILGIILFIVSIPIKTAQLAVSTTKTFKRLSSDESKGKKREPKSKLGNKISEKTKVLRAKLNNADDSVKNSSTASNKKSVEVAKKVGKTVARLSIKTLKLLVLALQIFAMLLTTFGLVSCIMMIVGFFIVFGAIGYVVAVMNPDTLGSYSNTANTTTTSQSTTSQSSTSSTSN